MLFEVDKQKNQIQSLEDDTYKDLKIMERTDLEEWVIRQPELLDEDLLIISSEYL